MERDKPFRTISELVTLLKSRELHIEDEDSAQRFLHQINEITSYALFQYNIPMHIALL